MPIGFIQTPIDQGANPTYVYTGTLDGALVRIIAVAVSDDLSHLSKAELDKGCNDIAEQFYAGALSASRMVSGAGAQVYRCTIYGGEQMAEGALYGHSGSSLAVFFSAPTDAFDDLDGAREELFGRRIQAP